MNSMMRYRILLSACAALALAGCATRQPPAELVSARQAVAVASQDADAAKAGAVQLQEARTSLDLAEKAFAEREKASVVREYAYAASRNADVARQQGAEGRAREAIAAGEGERNRVLLEARTVEVEQAKAVAEVNAAAADEAQAEADALKAAMAAMQARETERGMVVTLGDVLFDTNQAVVRPEARSNLERISAFLAEYPGVRAVVEGHTDSRGSDDYNRALSERRADAVRAVITRGGVAADRVRASGLGEAYPVASNETASGQQENRRVEIVFSDASGTFMAGGERFL